MTSNKEKIYIDEKIKKPPCHICGFYSIVNIKNTNTYICGSCIWTGLYERNLLIVKNNEIHIKEDIKS